MYEYYYQSYLLYYTKNQHVVKCFLYIFKKNNFLLDKTVYGCIIVIRPPRPGLYIQQSNTSLYLNAISNGRGSISNSRLYQSIYGYNQKIVGSCIYTYRDGGYCPQPTPMKNLGFLPPSKSPTWKVYQPSNKLVSTSIIQIIFRIPHITSFLISIAS